MAWLIEVAALARQAISEKLMPVDNFVHSLYTMFEKKTMPPYADAYDTCETKYPARERCARYKSPLLAKTLMQKTKRNNAPITKSIL